MAIKGLIKEIETFLLPQLNEIKGEIKALDTKIDSLRNEMKTELNSLRTEMKTELNSVHTEIKGIRENMDFIQRLTIIEQKLKDLKV